MYLGRCSADLMSSPLVLPNCWVVVYVHDNGTTHRVARLHAPAWVSLSGKSAVLSTAVKVPTERRPRGLCQTRARSALLRCARAGARLQTAAFRRYHALTSLTCSACAPQCC